MTAKSEDQRDFQVEKNKTSGYAFSQGSNDNTLLESDTPPLQQSVIYQEADGTSLNRSRARPPEYNPYPYYLGPASANPDDPPGLDMPPQNPYGMQQSTHSNTTVIVQQPSQPQFLPPRNWSSQMCECGKDWSICCCGLFCMCCLESKVAQDMGESCLLPCCVPCWLITLRTKMRIQEVINGTVMDDCCHVCCCYSCTLCQLAYEIKVVRNRPRTTGMAMGPV